MSKKTIRDIAIVMIVIFLVTVVTYPLIFGPEVKKSKDEPQPETTVEDFKPVEK
jgi:flagellar basal body-associated protein FliL